MKRIGIISDTHSCCDEHILNALSKCDEVWHGGDFGYNVAEKLREKWKGDSLKGVFGNIDSQSIRQEFAERTVFMCEDVKIAMVHIGGYPGHYAPDIKNWLINERPNIYICGHSHILKIMRDPAINNMLHINPGAAGKSGFQKVRTLVRLSVEGNRIFNVQAVEIGANVYKNN